MERKSFNKLRQELGHMDGGELREIIDYLFIQPVVEKIDLYQYADTLSSLDEEKIRSYKRKPSGKMLETLFVKGFRRVEEVAREINSSESRGVYMHLNKIYPHWKSETYCIVEDNHLVRLLPPWIIKGLEEYTNLSIERQILGHWRSQRSRNILSFDDYLINDFACMTDKRKKELIWDGIVAQSIFKASHVIQLNNEDIDMLANLSAVDLTMRYVHLVRLAFLATKSTTKTRKDAILYMRMVIGKLKFDSKSEGEFTTNLKNEISKFLNQN